MIVRGSTRIELVETRGMPPRGATNRIHTGSDSAACALATDSLRSSWTLAALALLVDGANRSRDDGPVSGRRLPMRSRPLLAMIQQPVAKNQEYGRRFPKVFFNLAEDNARLRGRKNANLKTMAVDSAEGLRRQSSVLREMLKLPAGRRRRFLAHRTDYC